MSPVHVREKPPLRHMIDVQAPGGRHYRLGEDEPDPANVFSGLRYGDTMPGGFETADCTLPREPGVEYPDLERLCELAGAWCRRRGVLGGQVGAGAAHVWGRGFGVPFGGGSSSGFGRRQVRNGDLPGHRPVALAAPQRDAAGSATGRQLCAGGPGGDTRPARHRPSDQPPCSTLPGRQPPSQTLNPPMTPGRATWSSRSLSPGPPRSSTTRPRTGASSSWGRTTRTTRRP